MIDYFTDLILKEAEEFFEKYPEHNEAALRLVSAELKKR